MADDRPDPPPSGTDLYEHDFYAWTQAQAEALRAYGAAGSNRIEWERVAEEIGDLGILEWNRAWTLLARIVQHLHKLEASPATLPRAKWRAEIRQFRLELDRGLTRSIRNGMDADLESIHAKGATLAQADMDDHEDGATVDGERRWTLGRLLGEADDPLAR